MFETRCQLGLQDYAETTI